MKTVAIIGLGARGAETYGTYILRHPERAKIVAVCDPNAEKTAKYGDDYGVAEDMRFSNSDDLFARGKIADVMIVASVDRAHFAQTLTALEQGYDILLEKPVSPLEDECKAVARGAKKYGRKVIVCHVMRYTAYYRELKRIIKCGEIGDVIAINQEENVSWWHQAHAFVRGNFGVSEKTSPMILQKCCHDADLLRWLADAPPVRVSSVGKLNYFHTGNAPKGCADRCVDCKYRGTCAFDAVKFYIEDGFNKLLDDKKTTTWPYNMLCVNPTERKLMRALETGKYGRCVFKCDNDVVDFQEMTVEFEGGKTGHLTMTGFTYDGGRRTKVMGTKGEAILDEMTGEISVGIYGDKKRIIKFTDLTNDFSGHGGGDAVMAGEFFDILDGKEVSCATDIETSTDSHLICFAAERSRLDGGEYKEIERV